MVIDWSSLVIETRHLLMMIVRLEDLNRNVKERYSHY